MTALHRNRLLVLKSILVFVIGLSLGFASCSGQPKQSESQLPESDVDSYFIETRAVTSPFGPNSITRNVLQDRKGNIWLATWNGIIRYDGKSFTNVTNKEELRRFRAFCILEDSKGNIWFGTVGAGVYRYDGKSFTNITTRDGLVNNRVSCFYEDTAGNIWIGTEDGASRYDGQSFCNFTTEEGLTNNDINSILEDTTGKLWFGTRGEACTYDGKTFSRLTNKEGPSFTNVRSIIEDRNGNIWLGGQSGLWRYASNTFANYTTDFIAYIYEDKTGNLWISSAALSRYDKKSLLDENATATHISTEKEMLCGIIEDKDGNIWFGSGNGVRRYDGMTINDFQDTGVEHKEDVEERPRKGTAPESTHERLRFEHGVRSILEDSKGNYWFGTWQEGVARFDGEKFTYFTREDGLDRDQVRNVLEDRNGTIWFDTGDGICSYDGTRITVHTDRDYSSKDDWKLGAGDLWFGEDDARVKNELEGQPGVYRYDGEQLSFLAFRLPKKRGIDWEYKCTGIARGKDGRIWFATYGSVIGYDPSASLTSGAASFSIMNNSSGGFDGSAESDLHVRSIFEDSKGRLWIGNNGIGVLLQEDGKTINFTQEHGLGSTENRRGGPLPGDVGDGDPSLDRVFSIGEDSEGNIWFGLQGTQGYGAWRYDGTTLRHFTEKDGLTSKHISVIYRDRRGDLWLGGDGVFKFNGKSFDRIH